MTTHTTVHTRTFPVEGMSCGGCAAHVEKALRAVDGVERAAVDLAAKNVAVTFDAAKTDSAALAFAVGEAGYTLVNEGA